MRILLLRLLLGWWFVPGIWLLGFPFFYLLSGDTKDTILLCKEISDTAWNGES